MITFKNMSFTIFSYYI